MQGKTIKTCMFVSSEKLDIIKVIELKSSKTIFCKSKQPAMILSIWKEDVHCIRFKRLMLHTL